MGFSVIVVQDKALPAEQDWAVIEVDGRTSFVVKSSAVDHLDVATIRSAMRMMRRESVVVGV